jgi:hypothetical protein
MKISLELRASLLLRLVKKRASQQGMAINQVIEAALRQHLEPSPNRREYQLRWHTETGRIQPGVDLENQNALLDLMEGR